LLSLGFFDDGAAFAAASLLTVVSSTPSVLAIARLLAFGWRSLMSLASAARSSAMALNLSRLTLARNSLTSANDPQRPLVTRRVPTLSDAYAMARRLLDDAERQQFNRGEIVSVAVAQSDH
jgi:hypothetical protein